jgi:transposase
VRELVRDVLGELNRSFSKLYASVGRPSIPPEQLLSALLLQVLYGIRSERQLMEQLDYNLLYRWFVGLSPDDPVWDPTVFTKNRDRLQSGEVFAKFMAKLLNHAQVKSLLSDEHFSVDGTLIEAWASHKSFRPKDGSGDDDGGANFHGQKRKNDTHASTTDPDSRLYRKAAGREAKLCYMGHATMENRHGLAVAGMVTLATGSAERRASETMLKAKAKEAGCRITVGEDKAYDTADHVAHLRAINVTPHVTQNDSITSTGKRRAERDRRANHTPRRLRHVAIAPGHDRMHLRLGQAARHHAQDQTSRHRRCRCRLSAQPDRLQPDPHPQIDRGVGNPSSQHQSRYPRETHSLSRPSNMRAMAQLPGFSTDC